LKMNRTVRTWSLESFFAIMGVGNLNTKFSPRGREWQSGAAATFIREGEAERNEKGRSTCVSHTKLRVDYKYSNSISVF